MNSRSSFQLPTSPKPPKIYSSCVGLGKALGVCAWRVFQSETCRDLHARKEKFGKSAFHAAFGPFGQIGYRELVGRLITIKIWSLKSSLQLFTSAAAHFYLLDGFHQCNIVHHHQHKRADSEWFVQIKVFAGDPPLGPSLVPLSLPQYARAHRHLHPALPPPTRQPRSQKQPSAH